jgi:DeoR/GlpR family transcriptional regulator of sugar metabolism
MGADLTALTRHDPPCRVYGGANPVERLRFEQGPDYKGDAMTQTERERIAKPALDELPEGGAVRIPSARRTVVLSDHTKAGNNQFGRFANLSAVDVVTTDNGLDEATAGQLGSAGRRVVRA